MKYGNCFLYAIGRYISSGFKGKVKCEKSSSRAGCTFFYIYNGVRYHFTSLPKGNMYPWFFKGKVIEKNQVVLDKINNNGDL